MKNYLLTLLLLCCVVFQTRSQNLTFSHLTTDDGLSQFSVNSLYVDEKGVVWIGTREGLNRYNGNGITTFKLQKNDPNSLFSNMVLHITGNRAGKLYLACTGGVAELDMVTMKFKTLLQENINGIYYREKLFISRGNKIFQWEEKSGKLIPYYTLPHKEAVIAFMHRDSKGNFWLGTENAGLFKLNARQELSHPIPTGNISDIYEDSAHELWVGTWEAGVYRVMENGMTENLCHNPDDPESLSSNFVRACCEDDNGTIWLGTFNGLNRYDRRTGTFRYFNADGRPHSLTHSSIWCIVKDLQGTLWMGTYFGGVNYFNPEYEIYTHYRTSEVESQGLSSPIVGRMLEDDNGRLWIGTEGGGLNVYDRKTGTFKWYRHEKGRNSLSHNNVKALYHDEKGEIMWIGTHLGGLNRLDIPTGTFTHYKTKEGDPHTLPSDIIRDLEPYKEKLLIATQNGICLFDPQTGVCEQMFKNSQQGKRIKMVADLHIDREGTLWIATTGEGVFTYRFDTERLTNYHVVPGSANSLSNNNINSITEDSYGNLWLATSGSGLDLYHPNGTFENFDTQKNGLASDCVYDICESSTQKGHLLIITNQGFSQFDYPGKTFYNYNTDNGFPLTAVNENALYMTRDGEVFLGGIQGMVSFYEKNLNFGHKPYQILLSRLFVNGKEINPGDETQILDKALCYMDQITLNADQSVFNVEFSTSDFIPANRQAFAYRLEGFSKDWTPIRRGQNTITYTNLNPGKYTLVIKAKDGEEGKGQEVRLLIKVLPPFYKTLTAYLFYFFVVAALFWFFIRSYNSKIKLRESLKYEQKHIHDLEELNQSKLRFFTNISHEFRTPLTLIVGQVETLLQLQSFTPTVYSKVLNIYKSSLQLRELITELLDFRKQEQGHMKIKVARHNLADFLYENYLLFQEYAKSRQISLAFESDEKNIEVWYDQKQMQKVINNLLSNALKYTKEGDAITLRVRKEKNNAFIEVEDNGVGIPKQEQEKIFDRFYQTEQLESFASGNGTGIGLALTKGIVELHQGEIRVKSEPGKGSCFFIALKLGNAHFDKEQISLQPETDEPIEQCVIETEEWDNTLMEEWTEGKRIGDAKILIVEDNEAIKQMLANLFETFYQVITASDGEEALEKVHSEMPNLVLSDVVMPRMSGTELCKKIKSDFNTCHIPVVLLTARTAIEHTIEGLRIGADDYITKPFNIHILMSRCNNLVNSRILLQEKFSKQPQAMPHILATNPLDKKLLDRATTIIEEHLEDTDFNVNTFATEMGMARTNLFTKLKAITGQTPNDFILSIRLKKGALLLRNNPELNITEVSDRIGFSSPRYFSKCFKDAYKINPLAYRRGETEDDAKT